MRTVVISHWDLDGLASAAILALRTAPVKIWLASVTAVPRYLRKALEEYSPDQIWISDLNPQASQISDLRMLIKQASIEGVKIRWIDHHEWDRSIYDLIHQYDETVWYLVDPSTVTADLVARKFRVRDNPYINDLVSLAIDDDFFLNRYDLTIRWRRVLRWYSWNIRYKALNSFIGGEISPYWMNKLYEDEVKNLYENLIREALGRMDIIEKNGIKIIIFQDVDPKVHPGELTDAAKKNGVTADIYIVRYPRGASLRSDYYDVSLIAKKLGGGGHPYAAGIPGKINISKIIEMVAHTYKQRMTTNTIVI
ncbi:MAG: phosphohydrolase [Crenarchaeota archaeon]|nr:phosphohydrolase [Thermoproteota archaeon]